MKLSFTDYELDTRSWHTDIFWRETAHLNVVRAKLNSQLNTSYCIVRRGMQSVLNISPSQPCQTCSAMSPHVASLSLLRKLDFIAEYNRHIVFIFCTRNCILLPTLITKFFASIVFIIFVAFLSDLSTLFDLCILSSNIITKFFILLSFLSFLWHSCPLSSLFLTNSIFTYSWH